MTMVYSGPKITCITGGSGFRYVAQELLQHSLQTAHVINVSDSGKSTRQLRLFFDMPAIGDLRSRLIDLADKRAPGYREISALLKHRLGTDVDPAAQETELTGILRGEHPLFKAILGSEYAPREFATIIRTHLEYFEAARREAEKNKGQQFDLKGASIGNFFLTGAYLFYKRDLETAIYFYKTLANVQGQVIPATTDNIHLGVILEDGSPIVGQHRITHKTSHLPIAKLSYLEREELEDLITGRVIQPRLNVAAASAIKEAEVLVFSMGSFFTSILSTLHLMGIAEAVRESAAKKVFIINPTEDEETWGMTAGIMAARLIATLREHDPKPSSVDTDYLQQLIVGQHVGAQTFKPGFNYIATDTSGLSRDIQKVKVRADEEAHFNPREITEILLAA